MNCVKSRWIVSVFKGAGLIVLCLFSGCQAVYVPATMNHSHPAQAEAKQSPRYALPNIYLQNASALFLPAVPKSKQEETPAPMQHHEHDHGGDD